MSGTVTPLRREGGPLTKAQRDLVKSVPGLAERVAYEVGGMLGGDPRDPDRVQAAHLGIFNAAQSQDDTRGPFPAWAKFKAVREVLTMERKQRKQKRLVTAGRIAGFRIAATRLHRDGDIPLDATDAALFSTLVGIAEEHIIGNFLGVVAACEEPPEGEDDVGEREEWSTLTATLLRELDKLDPENRELLLLFAHDHDVKAVAATRRVDYGTLREKFHAQLALLRARLKAQTKVKRVPRRPDDAGAVLPPREPPAPRPRRKPGDGGHDE